MSGDLTRQQKLRRTLTSLIAIVAIGGVAYGLGWSNIFQVKVVAISGSTHLTELNQALNDGGVTVSIGQRMARVNVKGIGNVLAGVDWVESEDVSRNWLSGKLAIAVKERSALASYVDSQGQIAYFDKNGVVFHSPVDLPSLPPVIIVKDSPALRKSAAAFIAALPADLISTFQGLTIYTVDHIVLKSSIVVPEVNINWGSASDLTLKVKVLRALIAAPENAKVKLIDLSNPEAPTVR